VVVTPAMEYSYKGTTLKIKRIPYYLLSLLALLKAMKPLTQINFLLQVISRRDIYILLKNDLGFRVKTLLDVLTLKEVVLDGEYEKFGVTVERGDKVIVDVGAGFGDFSILQAKRHPHAAIYAFEPDPKYFALLQENIRANLVHNIISSPLAVTSLVQIFKTIQSNPIQSNIFSSM